MTVPYPQPTTRAQARANAIYWAEASEAQIRAGNIAALGQASALKAQTWASIALAFPEDEGPSYITVEDGAEPVQNLRRMVETGPATSPIAEVDSVVWDVVRSLAVRFVQTSLTGRVTVGLDHTSLQHSKLLRFHDEADGSITVTIAGSGA